MALKIWRLGRVGAVVLTATCVTAHAQMPIGSVSTLDASVSGQTSIANDRAQLGTNGTVFAKEHGAFVQLLRGGSVRVCATSGVHLTAGTPAASVPAGSEASPLANASAASGATLGSAASPGPASTTAAQKLSEVAVTDNSATAPAVSSADATAPTTSAAAAASIPPPLMVALDRGAMELRMSVVPGDLVMTPDLRLNFTGDGRLDVRIRVGRNGDTCVENRVAGMGGHPGLSVGSLFGNDTYTVLPGQHVLFEGGNLREVVDNESSPCGCPEEAAKPPAVGDLGLKKGAKVTSTQAAVQHPFPADVSQGLAPAPAVPQAPPQVTHTQVATTLVYNGSGSDAATAGDNSVKATAPEQQNPEPQKKGFFHSVGMFFKRVF